AQSKTLALAEQQVREVQVGPVLPGGGFTLRVVRVMRTPGWTVQVDGVEVEAGRVRVRMTDTRPPGIVPQVLSPLTVSVNGPALRTGRHVVELVAREGREGRYQPIHVMILEGQ